MRESMPPPAMPQFGALKRRPFAFHPAILNVEHNEWRVRQTAGPEILVTNLRSDIEVWIPKRLIGEISGPDEPLLTVCLLRELEYKAGTLRPHEQRLVEMPAGPGGAGAWGEPAERQRAFSQTPGRENRRSRGRRLAAAFAAALVACLLLVALVRYGPWRHRDPATLDLTARDTYASIVHRLGSPARERQRPPYRALWYPERSCYVILRDGRYIGALDPNWRAIHHVNLPGSGDTLPLLRSLPRF
jgi:hypothetical protein